ncbi:S8 family serine peptidase [Bacillus sp. DX4.1]|uniref:S8 family serine peptidase n=1 Tax=Bacillus sp. DX4.1 TaxID=3055867 RepID=UPI0025A1C4EA|nr:S8 family serine peptidase [Bacillus sp. DX4.1]MDM5188067.1 S8 family serine peptidase [Bacillus sp. DX4.1]
MNNFKKQFAIIGLSSTLVLSQFPGLLTNSFPSAVAHAEENGTQKELLANLTPEQREALTKLQKPEELLANLTSEQRDALMKLQTINETGLHLAPEVNVESTDEISVIVEFKQRPHQVAVLEAAAEGKKLSAAEAKKQVDTSHNTFKKDLKTIFTSKGEKKAPSFQVKHSYKNAFNGVSMKLPANQVQSLLQSKEVKAVYSDVQVQAEPPVKEEKTEVSTLSKGMADEISYLQVDKLHQEGFTGKGIKVGVIDTGIDYNHPDLKNAFKGGYDFVDNDTDPMETTYEDWENSGKPEVPGFTYYTTHGTHVAGTIAGQGTNTSEHATTGIAPDAELYAYRVLGPYGSGSFAGVIAGIDKAVEDGMDVINMSLSAAINDPMYPVSMAVNNAVLNGVTAVVSAGNTGDKMYTLGAPAAAALAITVGASNVPITLVNYKGSLAAGQDKISADLRLLAIGYGDDVTKLKDQTLPIVDAGMGSEADFTGKDVKGKIALVSRGNNMALADKIKFAKKNGAAAVLLFNDKAEEGHIPAYLAEGIDYIPTFSLSNAEGLALKEKVEVGHNNFTFGEMTESKTEGDVLAGFSSRGPSRVNSDVKPEVTAPGVAVFSTVASDVVNHGKEDNYEYAYQRMSGTSMASPHVTGIAALLLQANPKLQPEDVKTILMNTADPLSKPYSVFEVGAGRVDPYEAIHSDVEIKVNDKTRMIENGKDKIIKEQTGGISFGTLSYTGEDIKDIRSLTLSNKGKTTKTFDVKVEFQTDARGSKDAKKNGVKAMTSHSITLEGGSEKKTNFGILIPKTAEKGLYEGYVVYTNKDNPSETYQVPFGVNYVEEGFENFTVLTKAVTTTSISAPNPFMNNASIFNIKLKSYVKRIDFLLIDAKTNQYAGYLGVLSGQTLKPNVDTPVIGFLGYYLPFIGDPNKPFSTDAEYLNSQFTDTLNWVKPGNYKIKAIITNEQGKISTSAEEPFFVDNTAPEFKLSLPHGVYEYEAGQKTVPVSGSIYDESVNDIKAAGFDVSQSINKVSYYYNKAKPGPKDWQNTTQGKPSGAISLNPDGTFASEMPMDESIPILPVRFYGHSISGAGDYPKMPTTYFVKKGTQYVDATPNKQEPKMGESVTYTLKMNNANKLKDQTFTFDYLSDYFEIESVTVNPELQKKANVQLDQKELPGSGAVKKHSIHVSVPEGIDGTMPMVDVKMKVKDNLYYDDVLELKNLTSSYINAENATVSVPSASVESYVIPTFSEIMVGSLAEGIPQTVDYSKIGATSFVTDMNNKEYKGTIANTGSGGYPQSTFSKLPVTDKEMMYHTNIPGHFTNHRPFTVFKQELTTIRGEKDSPINSGTVKAGDVNKDDVIDIMDAVFMKEKWGTNTRSADINFDGTVDMKDFAFIEKNFLSVNKTATNPPKPKEKYQGETLESIKKELEGK